MAYFSVSGVTEKAADSDIYEIKPEAPYTKDNLDWMDKKSRSSVEVKNKSFRPAIAIKTLILLNMTLFF